MEEEKAYCTKCDEAEYDAFYDLALSSCDESIAEAIDDSYEA